MPQLDFFILISQLQIFLFFFVGFFFFLLIQLPFTVFFLTLSNDYFFYKQYKLYNKKIELNNLISSDSFIMLISFYLFSTRFKSGMLYPSICDYNCK